MRKIRVKVTLTPDEVCDIVDALYHDDHDGPLLGKMRKFEKMCAKLETPSKEPSYVHQD